MWEFDSEGLMSCSHAILIGLELRFSAMEVAAQGGKVGESEVGRWWRCGWWRFDFGGWS